MTFHNGRRFEDDGSLSTIFRGSLSRPVIASGFATDYDGNVMIETDSPGPLTRIDGICLTQDGALFVTSALPGAGSYKHQGIAFRSDGAMHVTSGGRAAGDFTNGGWRVSAAGQAYITSSFQAKFADLGAGAVDTAVFSTGSGTPTFTRATAAAAKLSTGLWKLDVASGVARSSYISLTTAVGAYGGYLAEGAATQLALNVRDMTNASWIKVTMTTAQTSTGIDGVGNSCTRLTAAGANSTILQTLVAAASSRTYSCWVKRITGTGTILLKQGTATLDITALINSATFTLVQLPDNELNVAYGIQINTSADAIDVDCNQFEAGAFATTPIPAAGTRNADVLTYLFSLSASASAGTCYAEAMSYQTSYAVKAIVGFGDTSSEKNWALYTGTAGNYGQISVGDGTNSAVKTALSDISTATRKRISSWGGGLSITGDGLAVATGTFDGAMVTSGIAIGCSTNGAAHWFGTILNVRIWLRQLPDATLQAITA